MKKMDWEGLVMAKRQGTLNSIGRCRNTEQRYERFREATKQNYVSTCDHILINIFDCEFEMVNSKLKRATSRPDKDSVKFTLNRFPYHVDAHHFLVWFGSREAQERYIERGEFWKFLPPYLRHQPHFYHVNTPEHKTIPEIEHLHLFVKKRHKTEHN